MLFQKKDRIQTLWRDAVAFHGESCQWLALGVRVCDTALTHLQIENPKPGRLVCVSEFTRCCPDAIQIGLRCTIGRRHMLFYKTGKLIFTVYDLNTGDSVRMLTRPEVTARMQALLPEEILSMPEWKLFTFEEARAMTQRVRLRVTRPCGFRDDRIPQREAGVQDSPDNFRKFDFPK